MKILLACDPFIPHEDLVQYVTARIWPAGSEFDVLAVTESVSADFLPETVPDLLTRAATNSLAKVKLIADCLRSSGLQASPFAIEGDPADVIVTQAETNHSDLILMGAPRREESFPFLNSRVARAVVRHAHCSVQIVRTGLIRRVLLPTDGSQYSVAAARSVAARQWQRDAVFEVMSVVEPIAASVRFLYPPHNDSAEAEQLRADAMQHAQTAIAAAEDILSAAGLSISDHVLVPLDTPNKLILEEAVNWNADLIVMGSHGRRGIKRFFIGSVSESVAMHANCSVEIIR